ncbi:MAG: glycosyltransferase [Oscillospiraceae bacterium]|nr:glycosyltransferase [Oscillospiraceae bacterium]
MNILYLLFSFTTGGTERLVSDICNEMASRGHNVHLLIVNDLIDQSMLDSLNDNVQVCLQKRTAGGGDKLGTLLKIARYIRDNKIAFVHCNSFAAPELLLLKPLYFPKVKIIHTVHGMGQYKTLGKAKCLLRNLLCHRFIAISDSVKEDMLAYGAAPKKLRTVYNAINLSKFVPAEKVPSTPIVIGNVARIMPEVKGQDILLEALSKLSVDFRCFFAGGADAVHQKDLEALKQQAARLGIDQKVTFVGNVEDIPAFLSKLDIFVLPSRSEGFGISLIEAMAMGIPCIASQLDGPAEVLQNGKYGTLFMPESSDDLAQKLEEVLSNFPQKQETAKCALHYVRETFSIVTMCDHLEQVMGE